MIRGKQFTLILTSALALSLGLWLGKILTRPSVEPPAISGALSCETERSLTDSPVFCDILSHCLSLIGYL
jgi:hypothetical protein